MKSTDKMDFFVVNKKKYRSFFMKETKKLDKNDKQEQSHFHVNERTYENFHTCLINIQFYAKNKFSPRFRCVFSIHRIKCNIQFHT